MHLSREIYWVRVVHHYRIRNQTSEAFNASESYIPLSSYTEWLWIHSLRPETSFCDSFVIKVRPKNMYLVWTITPVLVPCFLSNPHLNWDQCAQANVLLLLLACSYSHSTWLNAADFEEVCFQNVVEPNRFEPEHTNELQQLERERGRERERDWDWDWDWPRRHRRRTTQSKCKSVVSTTNYLLLCLPVYVVG